MILVTGANKGLGRDVDAVYEVNVFGPVRMLHAFLPLLERSNAPVVVNVSSGLGSLTYSADRQRMATIGPDGPTGSFVSRDGPVPW